MSNYAKQQQKMNTVPFLKSNNLHVCVVWLVVQTRFDVVTSFLSQLHTQTSDTCRRKHRIHTRNENHLPG